MARRPPPGRCVHCLKSPVELTWDHVFPESWYPESTSPEIEKWKIPACQPCNAEHGKSEQDLMLRIGLCINPNAIESAGIVPKVLRSLKPELAKNERDRRMRDAKRAKILKGILTGAAIPQSAIYPGFDEKWDRPRERQTAVLIPKGSVDRIFEKIVRGLAYIEDGRFIEPPHVVRLYPLRTTDSAPFRQLLDRFGKDHARGPGITVRRAVAQEDGVSAIYQIRIWGMFESFAMVADERRVAR